MLILRRKTGGKSSFNLVQLVGECSIAETVLGSWVPCSVTEKALQLLISLLFASDSASEAINPERQKEVGRRVWSCVPKGREGKKGISSRVDGVTRTTWEDWKTIIQKYWETQRWAGWVASCTATRIGILSLLGQMTSKIWNFSFSFMALFIQSWKRCQEMNEHTVVGTNELILGTFQLPDEKDSAKYFDWPGYYSFQKWKG